MSTAKRSHSRRDARPTPSSDTPASKRLKSSHVPSKKDGLGFLVDDNARQGRKLEANLTNGVQDKRAARVDESSAIVTPAEAETINGHVEKDSEVIDISSAEEASSDGEDEDETPPAVNGHADPYQAMAGDEDVEMEDGRPTSAEPEEPSFGDMLQARHPETINVQAVYNDAAPGMQVALPAPSSRALLPPTGTSLSTVLTQALRTNDKDLLETCFQVIDQQTIRATIQRLQSHLVGNLMQRLAERIHRKPGRTGHLLTWIQWSLVAHGGYLVTQPQLMKQLRALNQVLRERAQGLQPLLQLKGKLDMLGAQLELRKSTLAASAGLRDDEDDEVGVLYIEGRDQDDDGSDSDLEAEAEIAETKRLKPQSKAVRSAAKLPTEGEEYHTASDDSDDEGSDMPNGIAQEGSISGEGEDLEDEQAGVFDLEGEESDDGEGSGEEDEDEDDDTDASSAREDELKDATDDDEEIVVQQPKMSTLQRKR